jgi:hypothetical protein
LTIFRFFTSEVSVVDCLQELLEGVKRQRRFEDIRTGGEGGILGKEMVISNERPKFDSENYGGEEAMENESDSDAQNWQVGERFLSPVLADIEGVQKVPGLSISSYNKDS